MKTPGMKHSQVQNNVAARLFVPAVSFRNESWFSVDY